MVYFFPILLSLFLMYHYDYGNHKEGRNALYIFIYIYAVLVAALRYRIGNDTIYYETFSYDIYPDIFDYWNYDFANEKYGRGYLFFTAIARTISDNFVAMQILLALFVNSIIFRFIYKNTKRIFTATLIYFLLAYLNLNTEVLRESCAVAIFLLGYPYFAERKWIKYYLIVSIALFFHPSSSFLLLLPILNIKPLRKFFMPSKFTICVAIGVYFLGLILSVVFFDLIRLIGIGTFDDLANSYDNSKFGQGLNYNIVGMSVFFLRVIFIPMLLVINLVKNWKRSKTVTDKEESYRFSLQFLFMCYVYVGCLSASIVILDRFNNYLVPFAIIILSDSLYEKIRIRKEIYKISFSLWMMIISPVLILPVYGLCLPSSDYSTAPIRKYYPYYSVLNPQLDQERETLFRYKVRWLVDK